MRTKHFTDTIEKLIRPEIRNTALLLGNGINNYKGHDTSWNRLLIDLADEHISTGNDYVKILNENSISYPEFFDMVDLSRREPTINLELKRKLTEGISNWRPREFHSNWVSKFQEIDRPILTTNFDYLLEKSAINISKFILEHSKDNRFRPLSFKTDPKRREYNYYYPWRSYYSNKEIKDCLNEFAIWHIHGFCDYEKSIRMGLSDYMGIVEKARKVVYKSRGNPFNDNKNYHNWIGRNTWLDIFFNNNLLIVGLGLDVQEVSLRWLLIVREKLFNKRGIRKKTWYLLNEEYDVMLKGKELLFNKLNIEIIRASASKDIYENLPDLL